MTVKGTLIATLAAGYIATLAPSVHADDKAGGAAPAGEKGEKASCKGAGDKKKKDGKGSCSGPNGCKGDKAHKDEKKAEKPAEEKK